MCIRDRSSHQLAYNIGQAISKRGKTLLTGATVGLPHYAAMGATSVKGKRGISIGFSPASSFREHVSTYRLPTKEFDYINFTGMEYVGRDVHLAVSYTHLRAHETDSYLVCRLLL